jgi:hypothetical protein
MDVNDNAGKLIHRSALESIAGKPAPTGSVCFLDSAGQVFEVLCDPQRIGGDGERRVDGGG